MSNNDATTTIFATLTKTERESLTRLADILAAAPTYSGGGLVSACRIHSGADDIRRIVANVRIQKDRCEGVMNNEFITSAGTFRRDCVRGFQAARHIVALLQQVRFELRLSAMIS